MSVTVTAVTPSKRVKDRFYIELDGGAEKLTVTLNQIADHCLYTGRELAEDELSALRTDAGMSNARATALRILGERNVSVREITEKLVCRGISEQTAEETAEWLQSIGAINDAEYAALIVRHYAAKRYGLTRIKDELYRRGIPRELWEDALCAMPDSGDSAYALLCSKLGGELVDRAQLKKATDAMCRRGFSWDEIRTAVQRYKNEIEGI